MEYIFYLFLFCTLYVAITYILFMRRFGARNLQIKTEYSDGIINLSVKNNSAKDLYINSAGVFYVATKPGRNFGWVKGMVSIPKFRYDITSLSPKENMPICLSRGGSAELSMPFPEEIKSTNPAGVYIDVSHNILDKSADDSLYERRYTYNFLSRTISKYYYKNSRFFRIYQKV